MNGSVERFQVLLLEGMKEAILTPASVAIVQHRYALRFKAQENFQDSSRVERVKHLCCLEISHLNGCVHRSVFDLKCVIISKITKDLNVCRAKTGIRIKKLLQ